VTLRCYGIHVLPVLDRVARGLAAALVRLNCRNSDVDLRRTRDDLSLSLDLYKLLVRLYMLKDGEELPRTASDKVLKTQALDKFFRIRGYRPREYCVSISGLAKAHGIDKTRCQYPPSSCKK
jgi:malonyl-CoA/methylmalonyl-CoA synthetase